MKPAPEYIVIFLPAQEIFRQLYQGELSARWSGDQTGACAEFGEHQ
jgi:hypothetical protein